MNRTKCPKCGERVPDSRQIACTACGIVFGEYERNQLNLLNEQREALVAEAAAHALRRLRSWIALGFALLGSLAGIGLYQIYNGLRTLVSDRIAAQFDEARIKETLNQVARTRANEIIEEEVRPSIETARRDTKEALQSFENFLTDTRARLDTASKEIQFSVIMARASNDDRKAFDELVAIADTPEHPFHDLAIRTVQNLVGNANLSVRFDPTIPWKPKVNPKELGAKEFQDIYRTLAPFYRPAVLSALWESERMTKREKLDFLAAIIREDDSLRAVERACGLMDREAKLNKNVLGAAEYVEWWERNREHY